MFLQHLCEAISAALSNGDRTRAGFLHCPQQGFLFGWKPTTFSNSVIFRSSKFMLVKKHLLHYPWR